MNLQCWMARFALHRNGGRLVWVALRSRMKRCAASLIFFPWCARRVSAIASSAKVIASRM